jgi:acetylglutamate kinase
MRPAERAALAPSPANHLMDTLTEKAATLHEALPYIQRFQGKVFVVKYGGHAMIDDALKRSFARDVALLRCVGIQVVVVHGGGPQINEALTGMGIEPSFQGGLRVTDDKTMDVVEMVLAGRINSEIVGLISDQGARAVGVSGKDDQFLRARRKPPAKVTDANGNETLVDLGRVGEVDAVSPDLLTDLLRGGYLPVVAPVAKGPFGEALNVNADTAAGRIAGALGAAKLMLMTDVAGVKNNNGELISELVPPQAESMIAEGVITGGMIPKVRCALDAVARGVSKVHIVDGRARHALLLEIFTDQGIGTEIKPS